MASTPLILPNLEFEYKALSDDSITLSGYMSTDAIDYAGDVIPSDSWSELLDIYRGVPGDPTQPGNPIFCLEHNRDPLGGIIGKAFDVYADSKGLMFPNTKIITDIPFVKDIVAPLIRERALTQQSVGFRSLDPYHDAKTGLLYHRRNLILEGSLVSIACNRECMTQIKTIDGKEDFETLTDMRKAYDNGRILVPSKPVNIPANYLEEGKNDSEDSKSHNSNQAMPTLVVTKQDNAHLDQGGTVVEKPTKKSVDYHDVAERLHLAVKETDGVKTYIHQIAVPTEKGFSYDFDLISKTICLVLGARNGDAVITTEEKASMIKRLSEVYGVLEKAFPSHYKSEEALDKVSLTKLSDTTFNEVTFHEGEDETFKTKSLINDLNQCGNVLASYKGEIPKDVIEAVTKGVYGSVELNLYAYSFNADDMKFMADILGIVAEYNAPDTSDEFYFGYAKWHDGEATQYGKVVGKNPETQMSMVQPYEKEGEVFVSKGDRIEVSDGILVKTESLDRYNLLNAIQARVAKDATEVLGTFTPIVPEKVAKKMDAEDIAKSIFDLD